MNIVSYTDLRKDLKNIMAAACDAHEPIIITRPHSEHMVLLSLEDYESLRETAYLLSDEANAAHLRKSLKSAQQGKLLNKKLLED